MLELRQEESRGEAREYSLMERARSRRVWIEQVEVAGYPKGNFAHRMCLEHVRRGVALSTPP